MKLEFQAKFLQYLNQKKQEEGFTLIELLVVIIIIGILAAIALPSLLGQANKAKQSEARQNIGAINRAQQAYFLENTAFTTSLPELGIGIKTQTVNYQFTITMTPASDFVNNKAVATKPTLKGYVGGVATQVGSTATTEVLTLAVACEANNPGTAVPANTTPPTTTTSISCPTPGFKDLGAR